MGVNGKMWKTYPWYEHVSELDSIGHSGARRVGITVKNFGPLHLPSGQTELCLGTVRITPLNLILLRFQREWLRTQSPFIYRVGGLSLGFWWSSEFEVFGEWVFHLKKTNLQLLLHPIVAFLQLAIFRTCWGDLYSLPFQSMTSSLLRQWFHCTGLWRTKISVTVHQEPYNSCCWPRVWLTANTKPNYFS